MWQGILQGAAWEVVKAAVSKGLDKLRAKGMAPAPNADASLEARWIQYSSSGKKQYEMFVSLRKTYSELPDKHAEAYAQARDMKEFGQIIRGELANVEPKPKKKATKSARAVARKR
jgi:hypothetical protein